LLDCTHWQHKDQPLRLYRANQHGLPLETVVMREPVVSESWSERTCSSKIWIPPLNGNVHPKKRNISEAFHRFWQKPVEEVSASRLFSLSLEKKCWFLTNKRWTPWQLRRFLNCPLYSKQEVVTFIGEAHERYVYTCHF